jgi:sugar lactone lactonase YvrE
VGISLAWLALSAAPARAATYGLGATALWNGPAAGSGSVVLAVTPASATWTAAANATWLHLGTANQSGTGSTNVVFICDANAGETRSGTLTIAGQTLTVTQAGSTYVAAGVLTTLVSSGLSSPSDVVVDGAGHVYIADTGHNAIKEWTPANNSVTTLAISGLYGPDGVAVDGAGDVFIADTGHSRLKVWTAANSNLNTVQFGFNQPQGVAVDGAGNAYVADTDNLEIDEWTVASGNVTTLVSSGLSFPVAVAVDVAGNVYIADTGNNFIAEWTAASDSLTPLVSSGLSFPDGVAVDGAGNVYIANSGYNDIEKWSATNNGVTVLVPGVSSVGLAVDVTGNVYFINGDNNAVQELPCAFVDPTARLENGAAGTDALPVVLPATENLRGPFTPTSDQPWLAISGSTNGVVSFSFAANTGLSRTAHITLLGQTIAVTQAAPNFSLGTSARLEGPQAGSDSVALAVTTKTLAWTATSNASWLHLNTANQSGTGSTNVVFNYDANTGATRSGALTVAGLTLTVTQAGSTYVAAGAVTTLVSSGLDGPEGVAVDGAGNVYIADSGNNVIKEWTAANNTITTPVAALDDPADVAVDSAANIYIADSGANAIEKWTATNDTVTTLTSSVLTDPPTFGSIDPVGRILTNLFIATNSLHGLMYADQNETWGVTLFYSIREPVGGADAFDTISTIPLSVGVTTDRMNLGSTNYDALTLAAPNVGYGAVNFYYVRHNNSGVSTFGVIQTAGPPSSTDIWVLPNTGYNALAFVAADLGYGANLFYYLRQDNTGLSTFGTINPTLAGLATDLYAVGTNFDSFVFVTGAVSSWGTGVFAYLRHDATGSIIGTINPATHVATDQLTLGTNFLNALTFAATDVGYGPDLFYYLHPAGTTLTTNTGTNFYGLAVDREGNVYIADSSDNAVKEWIATTGQLTTLVSSGLHSPHGVAVDGAGNVYIADSGDQAIKQWTAANSNLTTLVSSGLSDPFGVAVDGAGNVYIAAPGNNEVQKWTAASNTVTTLVSSGLNGLRGVAVDGAGNIYIADTSNNAIKELPYAFVDTTAKLESAVAGNDALPVVLPATANLLGPFSPTSDQSWLTINGSTNNVVSFSFAANPGLSRTAHVTLLGQTIAVTQVAPIFSLGATARLEGPAAGSDSVVLAVNPQNGTWTATANTPWLHLNTANQSGTGSANVVFSYDADLGATRTGTLTIANQTLTVTQAGSTYVAAGAVTALVPSGLNSPFGLAVDGTGHVYFADTFNNAVKMWTASDDAVTSLVSSGLNLPQGVAVDAAGNVYIADTYNNAIKMWTAASNTVTTLVSSGLNLPGGLAVDGSGHVFIADTFNSEIKMWTLASSNMTTLVSSGLSYPSGVAVDHAGNVYIADTHNQAIKMWMAATSNVTTLGSSGLLYPSGVTVDGAGNVYIADTHDQAIKMWTAATSNVTTLAALGLDEPGGVAVDGTGNVYIADTGDNAIKELPYAFVNPPARSEGAAAGADALPVVLPAKENLLPPFAPTINQSWLAITGITNGVVSFSFTAATSNRTANITVLGQAIPVTQAQAVGVAPPVLGSVQMLSKGVLQFVFTNSPGNSFTVLSATNLTLPLSNWTVAGAASNTSSDVFQFTSQPTTNDPRRFYRVRSP